MHNSLASQKLYIVYPGSTVICGADTVFDPSYALCARVYVRIPEVNGSAVIRGVHGLCETAVQVAPCLEQSFRVTAADPVL